MTPKLFIVPAAVNFAVYFGIPLLAAWRGGWRERTIGAVFAAQLAVNLFIPIDWRQGSHHLLLGLKSMASDLVLLTVCLACVVRARRYWVIWATAFALLEEVVDTIYVLSPGIDSMTYASGDLIFSYGLGAALLWASLTSGGHREAPG